MWVVLWVELCGHMVLVLWWWAHQVLLLWALTLWVWCWCCCHVRLLWLLMLWVRLLLWLLVQRVRLVLWLLVVASQKDISFRPITAVWLVGLPIVDMLTVFARRAFAGKSPFSADRTHIHHLLMESGMSARQTLLVLLGFHASRASAREPATRASSVAPLINDKTITPSEVAAVTEPARPSMPSIML